MPNLVANGRQQSITDWAAYLNVPQNDLQRAVNEGLSMQTIVDVLMPMRQPSRPVTPPNPLPRPGPVWQSPGGGFSFRTLCRQCAEQAKDYYELAHAAHEAHAALIKQEGGSIFTKDLFEFINFDGTGGAARGSH